MSELFDALSKAALVSGAGRGVGPEIALLPFTALGLRSDPRKSVSRFEHGQPESIFRPLMDSLQDHSHEPA